MSEQKSEKIQLVQNLYEAMARRDVSGVLAILDENISIAQTPLLPWGGEYSGHQGVLEFFQKLLGNLDTSLKLEEYFEAEDRVVVIGRTQGRVLKNNAPFDVRLVHIWTLQNGKVTRFEPFINTPQMLESLSA
jgi:ketosteroid isomerase-like protein